MKWFISRQCYWGVEEDEANVVEIAQGGLDYANPDMLVSKYSGEGEEYIDPREAVEAAIEIAKQWKKDSPGSTINIGHGSTGGMTMPFEGDDPEELVKWAKETWEELPKCDRCGEILPKEYFVIDDENFCREFCAEERERERMEDEKTYEIIRKYKDINHPDHNKIIDTGLTLEEAKEHCKSEDTHEKGVWFDAFEEE